MSDLVLDIPVSLGSAAYRYASQSSPTARRAIDPRTGWLRPNRPEWPAQSPSMQWADLDIAVRVDLSPTSHAVNRIIRFRLILSHRHRRESIHESIHVVALTKQMEPPDWSVKDSIP